MSVVQVVDMVAVRHSHVPAPLAVRVLVRFMRRVLPGFAFIEMIVVGAVQMPVVHVVDVIVVGNGDMATPLTMGMVMPRVLLMGDGHGIS